MIKGIIFDFNRTLFDPEKYELIDGVSDLLEKLGKKYKFCLITRGDAERLKKINLTIFEKVIAVEREHKDRKHFQECAEVMELKADEVLVVGDKIQAEITVGKSLGMKTAWFRFGKYSKIFPRSEDEKPDYVITDLNRLYSILEDEK